MAAFGFIVLLAPALDPAVFWALVVMDMPPDTLVVAALVPAVLLLAAALVRRWQPDASSRRMPGDVTRSAEAGEG